MFPHLFGGPDFEPVLEVSVAHEAIEGRSTLRRGVIYRGAKNAERSVTQRVFA